MDADTLQYVKTLNARRKRRRMYGWCGLLFGILAYIDGAAGESLPPIWLTGIWAFFIGTPIVIWGLIMIQTSYQLPIREALLFASLQNGETTVPELSLGLDVTLETAEIIMRQLVKKGYAQVDSGAMEEGSIVYKISGLQKV
jgi:hypothetical protein